MRERTPFQRNSAEHHALRVLCAMLSAGCAGVSWRSSSAAQLVDVFYATDRERRRPGEEPCAIDPSLPQPLRFGNDRNAGRDEASLVSFGRFTVRLAFERLGEAPSAIERRCAPESDPVYLAGPVAEDEDQFVHSVREAVARSASRDLLVFVHGYNFQFDEAVLWAAQLKHDLGFEGVVVLYSWPSRGSRWSYASDLVNAEWTIPHLASFLERLASQAGEGRVHVLAHSMGSKALVSALHALAVERRGIPAPRFAQIILAAPDIDAGVFRQLIPKVTAIAERITLYTAADLALRISGWLFAHPRAGDSHDDPVVVDGIDTVDVTAVDQSSARHNYFLENERVLADIFQLLAYRAPPRRRFRLFSVQLRGFTVWQFRT